MTMSNAGRMLGTYTEFFILAAEIKGNVICKLFVTDIVEYFEEKICFLNYSAHFPAWVRWYCTCKT
jgi:hypothetical protein